MRLLDHAALTLIVRRSKTIPAGNCRRIPIALKMPQKGEQKAHACAIAWSIRGDVKDIFLPRLEGEDISLPSSPVRETRGWVVPRTLHDSISVASLLSATTSIVSGAGKPWRLLGWQHIGLSEARGLVLSWVVREGIGVTRRLSAEWALHAYRR